MGLFSLINKIISNLAKWNNKSKLYYDILHIGAESLEEGITLKELKGKLPSDYTKYDSYINTIFLNNFKPIDPKVSQFGLVTTWDLTEEKIDRANKNKYRIDVESLSEYLKLRHSINNLEGARVSRCISLIALIISIAILTIGVCNVVQSKETNVQIKNKLDSILINTNKSNINDSIFLSQAILQDSLRLNSPNYDSLTNSKLHSINWKLLQFKNQISKQKKTSENK